VVAGCLQDGSDLGEALSEHVVPVQAAVGHLEAERDREQLLLRAVVPEALDHLVPGQRGCDRERGAQRHVDG
jgi:hypothetical protein